MNSLNEDQMIGLIVESLQGSCSDSDTTILENWKKTSKTNQSYFDDIEKLWKNSADLADFDSINIDNQWGLISQRITKTEKNTKRNSFFSNTWIRVAAAVLVLFGATFLFQNTFFNSTTLIGKTNNENRFELPDGSLVWLYPGSEIVYNKAYNDKSRIVVLNGKGYFEVVKDPNVPFIVQTNNTETKVLGTSFTIDARQKNKTHLVLLTGKVTFSSETEEVVLVPGEQVTVRNDGLLIKSKNEDPNVLAWKSKVLQFDQAQVGVAIQEIEKLYQVSLNVENPRLLECLLTTKFDNESLENVLETIKILFGAKFTKKNGTTYNISGGGC